MSSHMNTPEYEKEVHELYLAWRNKRRQTNGIRGVLNYFRSYPRALKEPPNKEDREEAYYRWRDDRKFYGTFLLILGVAFTLDIKSLLGLFHTLPGVAVLAVGFFMFGRYYDHPEDQVFKDYHHQHRWS